MQNKVKEFNEIRICHKESMPIYARLLDIESELGELSKEYLKGSSYGTKIFEPIYFWTVESHNGTRQYSG